VDIWLHGITTAVPENTYAQKESASSIADWTTSAHDRRLGTIAHRVSGIERRHSVLASLDEGFFRRDASGNMVEPTTRERNAIFRNTSVPLACELVDRLFNERAINRSSITHVITVTCTGFFNPGLDYHMVENCGLSKSVQRYQLGFMGCYAAISGLDMARQFCEADKDAVVLLVSLELCSLHLKPNGGRDAVLANALFADGAVACLVSACEPEGSRFRLGPRTTDLVTEGESEMAWDIGDFGFDMVLSSYVPKLLGSKIARLVSAALKKQGLGVANIDLWAVHPGGKAIIDEVQKALGLGNEQLVSSRSVLRDFGNMSSATILFVLSDLLKQISDEKKIVAMAFGPGLTVELFQMDAIRT
jgi:prepilin-type processing-associated H-X9-DG protein